MYISYLHFLYLASKIADRVSITIQELLKTDKEAEASTESASSETHYLIHITVAVAIPEGIFLPLGITAVHAANLPLQGRVAVVLVPIEPTEGLERLEKILQDSKPALIFVAADCDQRRIQDIIAKNTIPDGGCGDFMEAGPARMYRPGASRVVDLREWMHDIAIQRRDRIDDEIELISKKLRVVDQDMTLIDDLTRCLQEISSNTSLCHRCSFSTNENRISHIVYTSGTTGMPKGCLSSLHSLQNYIRSKNTCSAGQRFVI